MMCCKIFLFQAVIRCSANHRHYSEADCIMIGTITVVLTRWAMWECESGGETGVEALHPSAACRSAWVIRGSHFVSKTHHKSVCHEEETTLTLSGDSKHRNSKMCVKDMGEVSSKAATQNTHWMLFIYLTHQLLFPCSSLIIQSQKTGGSHVSCIYLPCLLP